MKELVKIAIKKSEGHLDTSIAEADIKKRLKNKIFSDEKFYNELKEFIISRLNNDEDINYSLSSKLVDCINIFFEISRMKNVYNIDELSKINFESHEKNEIIANIEMKNDKSNGRRFIASKYNCGM